MHINILNLQLWKGKNLAHAEKGKSCRKSQTKTLRGHSKMMSPQKCQILDPLCPMSPLVIFLITHPPPQHHQVNSDKLFPWSKTLKNNFKYFV